MKEPHITLSPEQEAVIAAIHAGGNVLVTGSAGTGKSTLLRAIRERIDKHLPVAASTGIAAVQVGGLTIHSWGGLGLADEPADKIAKAITDKKGKAYSRIKKAKRLALDEVSMIHADLFDIIDAVFRIVRDQPFLPFGGIQLILFGDFLQLPPVSRDRDRQAFAFQSSAWQAAGIQTFMLTKIFRQEDQAFSSALNQIRLGQITPEVRAMLSSRYRAVDTAPEIAPVTVYTHNADVDRENVSKLAKIKGKESSFKARDNGEPGPLKTLQKNCLAPEDLRLKIGTQVMLLWNIEPLAGLANGTLGIVTNFSPTGAPKVKFNNGVTRELERREWQIKAGEDVLAERSQYPLRLAWAITVHKSQGMTLDKIRVHLDRAFECGQSYVALSRVKTLEGLFIESTKAGAIRAHASALAFYGA